MRILPIVLILALFAACQPDTQRGATTPSIQVSLVDDFSGTRKGAQFLETVLAVEFPTILKDANCPVTVTASHVSQPHPNPVTCELRAFTEKLDRMDLDYPQKVKLRDSIALMNETAIRQFQTGFDSVFIDYRNGLTVENDHSYCNHHLQALSYFIADTTVRGTTKIAVIATDFVNDEPNRPEQLVDSTIIRQLNAALAANPNSTLYVITDVPREGTPLATLNATFLSNWFELKAIFQQFKKS